jgi:hypothetical protein
MFHVEQSPVVFHVKHQIYAKKQAPVVDAHSGTDVAAKLAILVKTEPRLSIRLDNR